MAPAITLLVDPNRKLLNLHTATTLEKYYPCFADGENYQPILMKRKYDKCNGKFFGLDIDEWLMYDLETVDLIPPSFVITFDKNKKVTRKQWTMILKWVQTIFRGEEDRDLNEQVFALIPKPSVLPEKITISKQIEPNCVPENREYQFRYVVHEPFDRALFEVIKPYTDRPYTAVIRNYSRRGMLPFFTALYVSTSWGVCNQDHVFLTRLWEYLNMQVEHGDLDLENRLKADIEKCLPREGYTPEPEPEVYRSTIEEVMELWAGKRKAEE